MWIHQHDCSNLKFLALLLALSGCPAQLSPGPGGDELGSTEEALFIHQPARGEAAMWPNGDVPVCFEPGANYTSTDPDFVTRIADAKTILEREYENVPNAGINFKGWGICTSTSKKGTVRFTLNNIAFKPNGDRDLGASAPPGYYANSESNVRISTPWRPVGDAWNRVVLHEFGHVLGFHHEFDRADSGITPACVPGQALDDKNMNLPFVGRELTRYDPDSILSATYCNSANGLSSLDELGLEIAYYDGDGTHDIAARSALIMGNGALLIQNDDVVTTDWTDRGALAEVYGAGVVSWSIPTTYVATTLPASALGLGTKTVNGQFSDFLGRLHLATGKVIVDNDRYAALVVAAIM